MARRLTPFSKLLVTLFIVAVLFVTGVVIKGSLEVSDQIDEFVNYEPNLKKGECDIIFTVQLTTEIINNKEYEITAHGSSHSKICKIK